MWKASVRIGRFELPVKLYAAVADRDVHFRLLHKKDRVPVEQRMVDARTGKEVGRDEVTRGVEVAEGTYVLMHGEELAAREPEPSRIIEVTRFVPRDAVDFAYFRRPYWLGPDTSRVDADYFALAEALREEDRYGICHFVMRKTRYVGALAAEGPYLALVALHAPGEVIVEDELSEPGGPTLRKEELALAEQLVETLDAPFDPKELVDDHRESVLKLIEAKASGKKFRVKEAKAPRVTHDLTDALCKSVRAAKEVRLARAS
jgi:DNA end-binding protein Ku